MPHSRTRNQAHAIHSYTPLIHIRLPSHRLDRTYNDLKEKAEGPDPWRAAFEPDEQCYHQASLDRKANSLPMVVLEWSNSGFSCGVTQEAKELSHDRAIPSRVYSGDERVIYVIWSPRGSQASSLRKVYWRSEGILMSVLLAFSKVSANVSSWIFEPFAVYYTRTLINPNNLYHFQGPDHRHEAQRNFPTIGFPRDLPIFCFYSHRDCLCR